MARTAAVVVGLVLAELGHRVVLRATGAPHDSAATRARLEAFASEDARRDVAGRRRWRALGYRIHPYTGFVPPEQQAQLAARKRHYEAHHDALHVAVLGGSVAESCFDSQLVRFRQMLRSHPSVEGREVFVINAALAGYKQPQQVTELAYLIATGFVPDVVVNIDGYNELVVAGENLAATVHPAYPALSLYGHLAVASSREQETVEVIAAILRDQRTLGARAGLALDLGLYRSSLVTHVVLPPLTALAADIDRSFEHYESLLTRPPIQPVTSGTLRQYDADHVTLSGPFPEGGFSDPLTALADLWESSSRSLQGICDAHGILYVHVLQPALHDEGSKPLTREEVEKGGVPERAEEVVRLGYPVLRERGARLAEEGVLFLDASRVFADVHETLYVDACHFDEQGAEILTDAVGEFVLEHLGAQQK